MLDDSGHRHQPDRPAIASPERRGRGPGQAGQVAGLAAEEAVADGVSFGCQTVGNFTEGACHFTDPAVGDYGDPVQMPGGDCPPGPNFDAEAACVDTMRWFAGEGGQAETSLAVQGTWAELWSLDVGAAGVYRTSEACREAVDLLAP